MHRRLVPLLIAVLALGAAPAIAGDEQHLDHNMVVTLRVDTEEFTCTVSRSHFELIQSSQSHSQMRGGEDTRGEEVSSQVQLHCALEQSREDGRWRLSLDGVVESSMQSTQQEQETSTEFATWRVELDTAVLIRLDETVVVARQGNRTVSVELGLMDHE